jgi:hypothetical protein
VSTLDGYTTLLFRFLKSLKLNGALWSLGHESKKSLSDSIIDYDRKLPNLSSPPRLLSDNVDFGSSAAQWHKRQKTRQQPFKV